MKNTANYLNPENYTKTLARLEQNIRSGRFASYTQQKKQEIWKRLCRYARQLGITIKASVVAACFAAGISFANPAAAQPTFTAQTGIANPFNGVDIGNNAAPVFVDIDGDGDKDAFIGKNAPAQISYYQNTGTALAPVFTLQTGGADPFNGVTIGTNNTSPAFADLDGDGDKDAFIGRQNGTISYFQNTGTASAPVFSLVTGIASPFNGIDVGSYSMPTFVNIDGDADMDVFIGEVGGAISYYQNTGTASVPVFTLVTGINDPLNGVNVGNYSAPAFADADGDGDMDAFIGEFDGVINYYENTGTALVPVLTVRTGAGNPFNSVDIGGYSVPAFADIDSDGDMDAFIGASNGTIFYYKNTTAGILPLQLLSFSGNKQTSYNQLQWQTAAEVNTKLFDIERSNDGRNFTKIATVPATGNGNNNSYSINDNVVYTGKIYYRLKMVDIDSRFAYSHIIWLSSDLSAGITIYPNPVTDMLNINIGNAQILKTTASVYDARGRLMQNIAINNNQQQMNVQSFAKGMYTIKFADGSFQKFVKE